MTTATSVRAGWRAADPAGTTRAVPRLTRRHLQIVLGVLWLVDAGLQLQPFMLGTGFARQVIEPAAAGQPHFVAAPVQWAASMIAAHPVAWDVPFAGCQLLIGLGILAPRTAKLALAASLPWALGVWFFGEGLSGLAGGDASLLTGAPGSALLYGVLAVAAWPQRDASDEAPARWLPIAWAVLWIGGAIFQALPGQNTGATVAAAITGSAAGAPHWLGQLDAAVAGWTAHHGPLVVIALVDAEILIGLAALSRRTRTAAAAAGFVLALVIWIVGQDFGQLYTGQATDPNTGPLIMLIAVALLGRRAGAQPAETRAPQMLRAARLRRAQRRLGQHAPRSHAIAQMARLPTPLPAPDRHATDLREPSETWS